MALTKFKDYYPNYRETFGDNSIAHIDSFHVYTQSNEQIGSVKDALVDSQTGKFRYLVVDTGFWIFGKNVLLPIGLGHFDYDNRRIYVDGLTKDQVENLPEYHSNMTVDQDYEERVRGVYRPLLSRSDRRQSMGQTYSTRDTATTNEYGLSARPYNRQSYTYDNEPALYDVPEQAGRTFKLYEERLIADKNRYKAGEVSIGKHVETETAQVSVPLEKERVVIERNEPSTRMPADASAPDFREGEVERMEVYEETANIEKKPYVREEVGIRKEVDRETAEARETLRREELDIDTKGNPNINKR
ncbi:MAG: DUF2382 domain-containing protein [Synechococcales bacterium]|nr:DUF2382 domain-containing protein [Synechococcales bacterium]